MLEEDIYPSQLYVKAKVKWSLVDIRTVKLSQAARACLTVGSAWLHFVIKPEINSSHALFGSLQVYM